MKGQGALAAAVVPEDQARADVYRLLAALLAAPPDAGLLATLGALDVGEGAMAPDWSALREAAVRTDPSRLEQEYFRLFIGLGRGELVPYASWYLTGFLMERPLAELRAELARLGFARREGVSEPEDHAAALCEVMGVLISENILNCKEAKVFFRAYLGSWLGRFFRDLEGAEAADFYRAVAGLGRRLVEIEEEYFSMPA